MCSLYCYVFFYLFLQTLFKRLIPHQCLGATWARRDKNKKEVHSVLDTIAQFNTVLYAVISSILIDYSKPQVNKYRCIIFFFITID